MCWRECSLWRQKHLKQLPFTTSNFNLYIQRIILKPAKEGFQIRPVQPRFQRGLYVKLHNSGELGLGTSRNVSGVSNASLQQHCDSTFFSIVLFNFSAIKGPAKDYYLCYVRNMWTKYFFYFQGLRELKCHWTKHSNHVNYRSTNHGRNDPCRRLFLV